MFDLFNFLSNNGALIIFAFFGFLAFYKGIPFLIKYNDNRHTTTENKLYKINENLTMHMVQSKNDKDGIRKDIDGIHQSIQKIQLSQEQQKGAFDIIKEIIKSK